MFKSFNVPNPSRFDGYDFIGSINPGALLSFKYDIYSFFNEDKSVKKFENFDSSSLLKMYENTESRYGFVFDEGPEEGPSFREFEIHVSSDLDKSSGNMIYNMMQLAQAEHAIKQIRVMKNQFESSYLFYKNEADLTPDEKEDKETYEIRLSVIQRQDERLVKRIESINKMIEKLKQ